MIGVKERLDRIEDTFNIRKQDIFFDRITVFAHIYTKLLINSKSVNSKYKSELLANKVVINYTAQTCFAMESTIYYI